MSNTNMFGNWYETEVGQQILSKKYYHDGETFDDFVNRVSGIFSSRLQGQMKEAIVNADFLPAGRTLYGAGSKGKFRASLSNCYIMDSPKDNIEDIFDTAKKMARIFSMGGGCGVNVSQLRPNGAKVHNAAKTSTGAVSFLNIFNSVGEVIGANNRRAALMLGLECTHPDIEEFLTVKQNDTAIQSANLSILFTDEFMKAVQEKKPFELHFEVESTGEVVKKTIDANGFFRKFCEVQWDYAEPGALYIDKIRNYNLLSGYPESEYKIDICNPCAEFTGSAWNACNLGSINLYNIVDNPFTKDAKINKTKLFFMVELGIGALDEILDYGLELQPLPENKQAVIDWRAIGLGVFGLADALIALGIRYGSEESVKVIEDIMYTMIYAALLASATIAKEKGTFRKYNWEYVKESPLVKMLEGTVAYDFIEEYGLRNGSLLSIAPTGSIATMCGLSGGIEPLYALSYERTTHALEKTGKTFKVFAKSVEHLMKAKGINQDNPAISDDFLSQFPYIAVSHDIIPLDRIKLQSAMQQYVDNAISSTVNLKNEATVDQVFDTYVEAWKQGCKGITIFRDGCARTSILGKSEQKEPQDDSLLELQETLILRYKPKKLDIIVPIKRNGTKRIDGSTMVGHTACVKNLYTTVNSKDGDIFEVFTNVSSGCKSNINTITRLASLALRSGIKVDEVVSELKANVCPACSVLIQQKKKGISASCSTVIGEAIEEIYKKKFEYIPKKKTEGLLKCPSCGESTLRPEGKCFNCSSCGYSRCD